MYVVSVGIPFFLSFFLTSFITVVRLHLLFCRSSSPCHTLTRALWPLDPRIPTKAVGEVVDMLIAPLRLVSTEDVSVPAHVVAFEVPGWSMVTCNPGRGGRRCPVASSSSTPSRRLRGAVVVRS